MGFSRGALGQNQTAHQEDGIEDEAVQYRLKDDTPMRVCANSDVCDLFGFWRTVGDCFFAGICLF